MLHFPAMNEKRAADLSQLIMTTKAMADESRIIMGDLRGPRGGQLIGQPTLEGFQKSAAHRDSPSPGRTPTQTCQEISANIANLVDINPSCHTYQPDRQPIQRLFPLVDSLLSFRYRTQKNDFSYPHQPPPLT